MRILLLIANTMIEVRSDASYQNTSETEGLRGRVHESFSCKYRRSPVCAGRTRACRMTGRRIAADLTSVKRALLPQKRTIPGTDGRVGSRFSVCKSEILLCTPNIIGVFLGSYRLNFFAKTMPSRSTSAEMPTRIKSCASVLEAVPPPEGKSMDGLPPFPPLFPESGCFAPS